MIITILNLILVLLALVGFVLTILTPVGIVLLVIYFTKPKEKRSSRLFKWSIILLSGIPLLVITFMLWTAVNLIATALGVHPLANPGGGLITLPI